jgi:tetratricopeptide (TPR) repeat protein
MSNKPNYLPLLERLSTSESFAELDALEDPSAWGGMTEKEQRLLGLLFVRRGGHRLARGEQGVLESFRLAEKLLPEDAEVHFGQGCWWLHYAQDEEGEQSLLRACSSFQKATERDPRHFGAWWNWGRALFHLGFAFDESHYFADADLKYVVAEKFLPEAPETRGAFYAEWGGCWSQSARLSGEAFDYRIAIEKFEKASGLGFGEVDFWVEYGLSYRHLADLIGDPEMMEEALPFLRRAAEEGDDRFEPLFCLATTLTALFVEFGDESYFEEAEDCFGALTEINSEAPDLWNEWAGLMLASYRCDRNEEDLEEAMEMLQRAANSSLEEAELAETHLRLRLYIAIELHNLEQMQEGKRFAERALELYSDRPALWCCYSMILYELGRYFGDLSYLTLGLEKLACAFRLTEEDGECWYAKGRLLFARVMEAGEVNRLDEALRAFERAEEYGELTPDLYFEWGRALMKQAHHTRRQESLEAAVEKFETELELLAIEDEEPGCDTLFHYACALDALGAFSDDGEYYRQAVEIFSTIFTHFPEDFAVQFHLAQALWHLGKVCGDVDSLEWACSILSSVVVERPDDGMAWELWGSILLTHANLVADPSREEEVGGLLQEAERHLLRALELGCHPASYELGRLYSQMELFEQAVESLRWSANKGVLPPVSDLMADPWFAPLRDQAIFRDFLNQL